MENRIRPRSLRYLSSSLIGLVRDRLWLKVLIGMGLGLITGILLGPSVGLVDPQTGATVGSWLAFPGHIFIATIQMIVIPLIVASIVRGLSSSENLDQLRELGIRVFTMREVDEMGMAAAGREALAALGDVDVLHVSWDMDSLDPQVVSGVGTPVPGGLTYREAHLLAEMLHDDGRVRSLDIVEINPTLDRENQTALLAVEIAASLFGQRIL